MTVARKLFEALSGIPDHPGVDVRLAISQTNAMRDRYKAPHANRSGQVKAPRRRPNSVLAPLLFAVHRP